MKDYIIASLLVFASGSATAAEHFETYRCKVNAGPVESAGKTFVLSQQREPSTFGTSLIDGIYFIVPGYEALGQFRLGGYNSDGQVFAIPGRSQAPDVEITANLMLEDSVGRIRKRFNAKLIIGSETQKVNFDIQLNCRRI